jgi:hypothetical protein
MERNSARIQSSRPRKLFSVPPRLRVNHSLDPTEPTDVVLRVLSVPLRALRVNQVPPRFREKRRARLSETRRPEVVSYPQPLSPAAPQPRNYGLTGDPARGPFDESRARAPVVSPAELGCPVGFDVPVVLSPTFGVADMSRVVAGAAAPVSPSVACLLLSPQPMTPMTSIVERIVVLRARRRDTNDVMGQPVGSVSVPRRKNHTPRSPSHPLILSSPHSLCSPQPHTDR